MKATPKAEKQQKITKVLSEMRNGLSLRQSTMKAKIAKQTFLDWVDKDPELSGQYAQARADMIDCLADEIMEIADEKLTPTGDGKVDSAMVQWQKLRMEARKWALSKMAPKKYGDKLELSGDEHAPIPIQRIERVIVKK
tara:strand:- start:117 stop:533 length:417 start_codon:yes stop_codon:yes gene_type:complete